MASFAELNENNIVLRVVTLGNDVITDSNNIEQEEIGILFLKSILGGKWKQTSYSGKFRRMFAGIGYKYLEKEDIFIPGEYETLQEYEEHIAITKKNIAEQNRIQ